MTTHLVESWLRLARAAGGRGDVAGTGARLIAAYTEEGRAYHDLQHLDEVLRHVDELGSEEPSADLTAVRLAAWFHDAVYDGLPDMEERSAALASGELDSLRVAPEMCAEVARLVRLTATHEVADGDSSGALLCDADLAILASDPERYAAYAAGVREEYAGYDDATFAAGRSEILRGLLARPSLFRTAYAASRWEQPARHNIETELLLLSAGGSRDSGGEDPTPEAG